MIILFRSISFLSILLERDDRAVRIAAGEAIALIFEIGRLDKFSREEGETDSAGREGFKPRGLAYVASMKGKILNQVRELSAEAGGKGTGKKDLNLQRDLFQDILIFLEVFLFSFFIHWAISTKKTICSGGII